MRTPDERFLNLPGFAFAPRYLQHAGLRVHYVDEGPADAAVTALCLHGNPSWSYLYRQMIPVFTAAGLRVVAPDLVGFGRSDKPVDAAAHTFDLHRGMLMAVVDTLRLKNVLLVVQDWGGIFGLTLPMACAPAAFTRLLVMNTALGTGSVTEGFRQWRAYSNAQPDLPVGRLLARGKPDMTPAEAAAYDAPFPDASYKAALRALPNLVPDGTDAPGAALGRDAAAFWRQRWQGDSFMAIGMQDPVLGPPAMRDLHAGIRNAPPPLEVAEAGHFVPEWGVPVCAGCAAAFPADMSTLHKPDDLDTLRGFFRSAPFMVDLGVEPIAVESGRVHTQLVIAARHLQHTGVVHAGVMATMADHSMGAAAQTLAPAGHWILTAELKTSLLRGAQGQRLVCQAHVLKAGRRISFTEAEVFAEGRDGQRTLVMKASATMAVTAAA